MHAEVDERAARYVAVGDVVAGTYLVERVLAVGDMTFVVAARNLDCDQLFALEFLTTPFLNDTVVARFVREARAACRVRNMHAARVYDVGTHEGAPFMILDHDQGRDLSAILLGEGPLRVDDAVELALHACEGLAAAHAEGVLHRHLTPENLFVVEHGGRRCLKVHDVGISRAAHVELEGRRPRAGEPPEVGAPGYMAPEQIRSAASADERSDVWSLGVVLYELLSGTPAFSGVTVTEVCAAVLEGTPAPLTQLRSAVPRALAEVVARAMEKDPRRRFATVTDLATALLPFARREARTAATRWCLTARESVGEDARNVFGRTAPTRRAGSDVIRVLSSTPTSWSHSSGEGMLPPPPRIYLDEATDGAAGNVDDRAHRTARKRVGVRGALGASLAIVFLGVTTFVGAHRVRTEAPRQAAAAVAAGPSVLSPRVVEAPSADATAATPRATRDDSKPAWRVAPTRVTPLTSANILATARGLEKPRAFSSASLSGARKALPANPRPAHGSVTAASASSASPSTPMRRVDLGY